MEQLHQMLEAPEEPVDLEDGDETVYGDDIKIDINNNNETIYDNTIATATVVSNTKTEPQQEVQTDLFSETKESNNNKLFYILLVVLALVACVGGYWYVSGHSSGSEDQTNEVKDSVEVTTIYDSQGQPIMTFSGQVVQGQPQGNGVLTYLTDKVKDRYEGVIKDGLREDSAAVLYFKNGDVFRGAFEQDHFVIGAYYVKETGEYFQGKFKNDQPWNGVWYDAQHNVISRVDNGVEK